MPRELLILPWEEPLLPQLVRHLVAHCVQAPWDLRDQLIIVPTQESGRRLRQGLAAAAAGAGTGVLAPTFITPEQLVRGKDVPDAASDFQALAAWCEVLQALDLDQVRAVFPTDPPDRDAAWAVGMAGQLATLQGELAHHGLDFSAVAERVSGTDCEPDRWEQLGDLEAVWRERLAERGLVPLVLALRRQVEAAPVPAEVQRVVLAAVLDPSPLALALLERWSRSVAVEVICHGPTNAPLHDAWGRPRTDTLETRELALPARARIRVVRDTREGAGWAARLAQGYSATPLSLALGLVDQKAAPAVQLAFAEAGVAAHDPAGSSLASTGLGLLARELLRLAGAPRLTGVTQILRHPLFGHFACAQQRWADDPARLLVQFDELLSEHLPVDLPQAVTFAQLSPGAGGLAAALEWLLSLRQQLLAKGCARTLAEALTAVARGAEVPEEDVEPLRELLAEAADVEERFPRLAPAAVGAALEHFLGRARRFVPAPLAAWDLQGWMELPYEEAPHLVLIGFNEGQVPETIHGHAFLPNALREHLGLHGNRERFARDHLLLESLLRSRAAHGRVDIVVPRLDQSGDPRQPSRLLFRCADDDLVARARLLFGDLPAPPPSAPRRAAWQLSPLPVRLPRHFSPSSLKAYLTCPFRYYLTHILRAESVDVGVREIPVPLFGKLCHHALQQLGESGELHDVVDPALIEACLIDELDQEARRRFGSHPSFAVHVQLESARARLRAAAAVEAGLRQEGWRTVACEEKWVMEVAGIRFEGRIDRVDRHEGDGRYRLIDYKTFDRNKTPPMEHWGVARPDEPHVLPESVFDREGKPCRWLDLQLPLYLLAMRARYPGPAEAGYFVLPKTKEETGLRLWSELTPDDLSHAQQCAVAVARAVEAGRFWPAARRLRYEHPSDYLFPNGVEQDVAVTLIQQLAQPVTAS